MKNYEDILKALECCAYAAPEHCDVCPYKDNCAQKDKDAIALIEEMKAKLDALPSPTAMSDYEAECRRLEGQLCKTRLELEEKRFECSSVESELIYLRAIKAAAEAFLGREIK